MRLLIRMVRTSHHRTTSRLSKSHGIGLLLKLLEALWADKSSHWQMVTRWLQILTQGQHGDSMVSEVLRLSSTERDRVMRELARIAGV